MSQPNVLFILADQHRWDFMGCESNGVTLTPNLESIAAGGVAFRSAYCNSPLCSPSRAAITTGRCAVNSGCYTNLHQVPPGEPTFIRQFRSSGYRTAAFGKAHMEIHAYDSDLTAAKHREYMDSLGWDEVCEVSGSGMLKTGIRCAYSEFLKERGAFTDVLTFYKRWGYFMDAGHKALPEFACNEWPFDESLQESRFIADRVIAWLHENAGRQPFLLHVGFAAPHSPIEPLPRFMDLYREREEPLPFGVETPPDHLLTGRRGYRAMITQIDEYVGLIRTALEEAGVLDNTIIVYTADHGEMAGDFGLTGKVCFFEGSVRVPLIVSGHGVSSPPPPGEGRGEGEQRKAPARPRTSDAFVEGIDLGRTLCDLCSVESHALDQGRSLVPILHGGSEEHRDTAYSVMGCDRMIRDERYKLMWGDPLLDERKLGRLHLDKPVTIPPSPPRLYDLVNDPHETNDLIRESDAQPVVRSMMEKLMARINADLQPQPNLPRGEYRPL